MKLNYINIYNDIVNLTRNKELYRNFINQDTFSDRLIFFLLHFAFFIKVFKKTNDKKILQEIYDYIFRQLELSIREIGYGDQTINKKMKEYLNFFYDILNKIDNWENLSKVERKIILQNFLDNNDVEGYLADYFEKYRINLLNSALNSYINGIVKP